MKHVKTVVGGHLAQTAPAAGCGECQTSCQSACKTSCTVASQRCENNARITKRSELTGKAR